MQKQLVRMAFMLLTLLGSLVHAAQPVIDVYKSAYCGCCEGWVKHLREHGFTVNAHNVPDPSEYRAKFGIPEQLGSCHSGRVGNYVLEGHVPAADVLRLLTEKPAARGLAVPGMPLGSPGMEAERSDAYDVVLIGADGKASVFSHYPAGSVQASAPAASLADGVIRQIDHARGQITISHSPLVNLGMPAMTMAFEVSEGQALRHLRAGDKIRFVAEKHGNGYRVARLERAL